MANFCAACGSAVSGRFCSACGAQATSPPSEAAPRLVIGPVQPANKRGKIGRALRQPKAEPSGPRAPQPRNGNRWWRFTFENNWPVWVSLVVRLVIVLFLLAGGGTWLKTQIDPKVLAGSNLESQISPAINQQMKNRGSTARVTSLSCEDIKVKKGSVAACDLALSDGEKGTVQVTMQDDLGHYQWQIFG